MRTEIGSEFWDIPVADGSCGLFPDDTVWLLSGRVALDFLIRDIKKYRSISSAALPSYCCDSMILPFVKNGISVSFYPVWCDGGRLRQELSYGYDCDVMLVMNYFGYHESIDTSGYDGLVIQDMTHSVFCRSGDDVGADYVFGSMRKWAGFYTGGFAWKRTGDFSEDIPTFTDESYVRLRKAAMTEKEKYILGKIDDKSFLGTYASAEDQLENYQISAADKHDIASAKSVNKEFITARRRENAAILLEAVSDMAVFSEIKEHDCPLFVPIRVPRGKRDSLRRYLIEHQIYCPIHWPISELHKLDARTETIYDEELSLICDQRYNADDMHRICDTIKDFCM